jgi:4-hydroxy-3-polyprenylbenzoate decarboxylase
MLYHNTKNCKIIKELATMAYKDLRDFMRVLEERGELKRITTPVDCHLEITEITDRVSKKFGPALLFENVIGHDAPVLTNAFGSMQRMAWALGVDNLDQLAEEIRSFIKLPFLTLDSKMDMLKLMPMGKRIMDCFPRYVNSAPCKEVILKGDAVDLTKIPVLQCWPGDGGPFVTLPLVFTKNPHTGKRNVGMYRLQVYDKNTTGMHWHVHHNGAENYRDSKAAGKKIEVAVAIGGDPALTYAATAPLPRDIDEVIFAGFLRKSPVELVKCETVDLEVPADAEYVLEGYVDPDELRLEGPFGDHTGYYSQVDMYPVFHVTCITRRQHPIYPATIVGKPPMEDCYLGKATERLFLPLLQMQLPEIVDINLPLEGVFHNCAIISIKKSYPAHAKKIMHAVWGMGQMMFTKMVIIVDEHVKVHDLSEVWWRVYNNIDAARDVVIVEGPLDALDHSSPYPHFGAKMGIDATKAWKSEGYTRNWPDEITMSENVKKMVDQKWKELGFE